MCTFNIAVDVVACLLLSSSVMATTFGAKFEAGLNSLSSSLAFARVCEREVA